MAKPSHPEIVTFKADRSLLDALAGITNRSEFIRAAVMAALENACPLCKGRGLLLPEQKRHWQAFAESHRIRECDDCHAWHLTCATQPNRNVHSGRAANQPPAAHRSPRRRGPREDGT